jgi:D-alanyl-D-alanine carboxypeptidase
MREGRGGKAVHGAQLGVLVASLIAATIFLVFVPEARVEAESTTHKGPVGDAHAPKASLGAHDEGGLPLLQIGAPRLGAAPLPVPKTAPGEDRARRLDSPVFGADEGAPPSEDRSGEGGSPETAPSPPVGSCDDPLALVDQGHPLPRDYVARDLVPLGHYGIRTLREDAALRRGAAEGLARLVDAAEAAGEDLVVASAYRSFEEQHAIHAGLSALYGEETRRISARAGHSEHQLGTTVDFTNAEAGYALGPAFEDTGAYRWLLEHARDYGFVQSYRRGKEKETGYQAESWHYRYVGTENARRLEATGLSLRAFLLREGVMPRCDR